MKNKKVNAGKLHVRANFSLESLNEETRTIDFVFSTGSRGVRKPFWSDPYYEELEISEGAVDLSRMNNGAPFLLVHRQFDIDAVIGVIERSWVQDNLLYGTVRFGKDPASDQYFQKLIDGILRKVSVGYFVNKYEVTEQPNDYPVKRAISWMPIEASLVPIGFDDDAQARASERAQNELHECELVFRNKNEEEPMDENEKQTPTTAGKDNVRALEDARKQARNEGVEQEKKRQTEIRAEVKKAKLADEFASKLIEENVTVEQARERIIDAWAEDQTPTEIDNKRDIQIVTDERDTRRSAMEQALLFRCDSQQYQVDELGRRFANMSLLRIAEELVPNASRFSKFELAERALSTSDLKAITANVFRKRLIDGYTSWNRTFVPFVTFADLPDFKEVDIDAFGGMSDLLEVPEGGEYQEGTVQDKKESYRLGKFGRIISFTEEMVINDDMRALNRMPRQSGGVSARLENKLTYGQLTGTGTMSDGKTLFHADHGNLATGAAISDTSLSAMRKLGREQTFGDDKLNVEFKYLVAGSAKEVEALKILRQVVVPTKTSDSNVFFGTMSPIIDPNISGNQWFTIGDPNVIETIEVGYLQGTNRQPIVTTMENFKTGGISFKIRHIVSAKAADWRGMAKNPGN